MNKLTRRITAAAMGALLCLNGTAAALAAGNENTQNTKEETVYILADAEGGVRQIIVSDWLRNAENADTLTDCTELTDIENVKGSETFTQDGSIAVWSAGGNDICYQGTTDKELPVSMTVSYTLDGEPISASELAGKSGLVTIRFSYENRCTAIAEIGGKNETVYVPFAVLTAAVLDNSVFRNITVSGGKLVNDGERTAVVGFAFPGLQETLNLDTDKIDIPDYVEITADCTDFRMGMTMTIAANELFNNFDTAKLDPTADSLSESLDALTGGMTSLLDGSSALYDGMTELLTKAGELSDGVATLADGASALKDGAAALDDGAAQLKDGAAALVDGLNTLTSNNDTLNGGAHQIFESLLATASAQIAAAGLELPALTPENYAEVLDGAIASLDEEGARAMALQQVTAAVEENRDVITMKVTEAVQAQVTEAVTAAAKQQVTEAVTAQVTEQVIQAAAGMSAADYEAALAAGKIPEWQSTALSSRLTSAEVQGMIETAVSAQMASEDIRNSITANTAAQMQSESVQALIAENTETRIAQIIDEQMAGETVQTKLAAAAEGCAALKTAKAALDSYNTFYCGLQTYTAGVASAASGAGQLSTGSENLKNGTAHLLEGAAALSDGTAALNSNMPALLDGITALKDGSAQLSDGLKQFNEEGIQKIVDFVDGDLENIVSRLRAAADASKAYNSFSGISEDMDGQVKFIYRTDAIE